MGIERMASVDSAGTFGIKDLPAGLFTLRIIAVKGTQTTEIATDQVSVVSGDTVPITMPGWKFSKRLWLNTTASGANVAGTVMNFPVLVRLSSGNLNFSDVKSGGEDLRFTKSDGTPLSYEIEHWDASQSSAAIWVKVDTIFGNDSTHFITMYWGLRSTGSATASLSNGAAVFDTAKGFQGVWHLNEASGQAAKDATANRFDGTPSDTAPTAVSGTIGLAQEFDGKSNYLQMPGTAGSKLNFPENGYYSLSAWVFVDTLVDSTTHVIAGKGHQQYFLKLYWGDGQHWEFTEYHDRVGWQVSFYSPAQTRAWKFLVGVRDGNNQYLYLDGELVNSSYGIAVDSAARNTTDDFSIGKYLRYAAYAGQGFCWFDGKIDEVRVSNRSLTADWNKLCYMNQKEPDALIKW
jgi:biopolymer transport protein ExbB